MPPKKKATKLSLNEFLADQSTGSWADETAHIPVAPIATYDSADGGDGGRSRFQSYSNRRDPSQGRRETRSGRPPREQKPLPDKPPFIAFMGNLSYDVTEENMKELVAGLKFTSIRLIKDHDNRPKGFGYVEFEDLESLKNALTLNGENFYGKTLTVDVAESNQSSNRGGRHERSRDRREGDRGFRERSDVDMSGNWRRNDPLPPKEPRGSSLRDSSADRPARPHRSHGTGDRPPRREEPQLDFGAFRRGETVPAPVNAWGKGRRSSGPKDEASNRENNQDRPALDDQEGDGRRQRFSSTSSRGRGGRGGGRGGSRRSGGRTEDDLKAMEKKLQEMRFGKSE